jgi:hypothetical protein
MKIYNMKHLILPLLLVLLVSSCKKQEGCTNPTAINYNSDAENDDGSCTYTIGCTVLEAINYNSEAVNDDGTCLYICEDIQAVNYNDTIAYDVCEYESSIVVWLDETASQYLDSLSIPFLSVNVGNEQIPGAIATENFYSDVECIDTNIGLIHYVYKWEDSLTSTVTFTVLDGTNIIMYQSIEAVLANGCAKLLLTRDKIEDYLGS